MAITPPFSHVIWDTQVVGNTIVDDGVNSPQPAYIQVLFDEVSKDETWGGGALGVEIRNNNVVGFGGSNPKEGIFSNGALEWPSYTDEHIPFVLGTIMQNNSVENVPTAYSLNTGSYANVIWDYTNNFDAAAVSDTPLAGTTHASTGTVRHTGQVIQAESGTWGGGAPYPPYLRAPIAAAVGSQEIAFQGTIGSYSEITGVSGGTTGGLFPLTIRYAQGQSATTQTDLYVNGVLVQSVQFPVTRTSAGAPSWNVCGNVTVYVPLNPGSGNTIRLQEDNFSSLIVDQYSIGN